MKDSKGNREEMIFFFHNERLGEAYSRTIVCTEFFLLVSVGQLFPVAIPSKDIRFELHFRYI